MRYYYKLLFWAHYKVHHCNIAQVNPSTFKYHFLPSQIAPLLRKVTSVRLWHLPGLGAAKRCCAYECEFLTGVRASSVTGTESMLVAQNPCPPIHVRHAGPLQRHHVPWSLLPNLGTSGRYWRDRANRVPLGGIPLYRSPRWLDLCCFTLCFLRGALAVG